MADRFGGEYHLSESPSRQLHGGREGNSGKILVEAIKQHVSRALYRIEVVSSDEPLELLVERSSEFDLLIRGTTKEGFGEGGGGAIFVSDCRAVRVFRGRRQSGADRKEVSKDLSGPNERKIFHKKCLDPVAKPTGSS